MATIEQLTTRIDAIDEAMAAIETDGVQSASAFGQSAVSYPLAELRRQRAYLVRRRNTLIGEQQGLGTAIGSVGLVRSLDDR